MSYALYNTLAAVAYGAAFPVLHGLRVRRGREWEDRLGRPELPRSAGSRIWIHAASVGELRGVRPLVERIRAREPSCEIVLSTLTRTGQALARGMPGIAGTFFLPLDVAGLVRRAVERAEARVLILMETEIWPNLIRESARRGTRIAFLNGRVSGRSYPYYRMLRGFLAEVLEPVVLFGVQSERDRDRFIEIGAAEERVRVLGSTKYDAVVGREDAALAGALRQVLGERSALPLWVAGCVRPGEEGPVLDAYRVLDARHPMSLVLAPRHLEEVPRIEAALARRELRWVRWTRAAEGAVPGAAPQVLVLDTIGDLGRFYGAADVAFLGGGLVRLGGHNPLEPAAFSVPVVLGPHMDNYRLPAERLLETGAAVEVRDASGITAAIDRWVTDPEARKEAGRRALETVGEFRGAADRCVDALEDLGIIGAGTDAAPARTHVRGRSELPRIAVPLVSAIHRGVSTANRWAYRRGIRRSIGLASPVVSVGNLSLGGTGKTPLVAVVARRFTAAGLKVGVLSRGYRRERSSREPLVVSDGSGPRVSWYEGGDEPCWLAERVPGAAVVVGRDRVASGRLAESRLDCRLLVLDDGFQHSRLRRDLDIVLIDSGSWTPGGRFIGAHWLREGLGALAAAGIVVLRRADAEDLGPLRAFLMRRFPHLLIAEARYRPSGLRDLASGEEYPLASLRGERVSAVCGLASPDGFERTLSELGATVVDAWRFPDHYGYRRADLEEVADCAPGTSRWILTTEKDAVRLRAAGLTLPDWRVLAVEMDITAGREAFDGMLDGLVPGHRAVGDVDER